RKLPEFGSCIIGDGQYRPAVRGKKGVRHGIIVMERFTDWHASGRVPKPRGFVGRSRDDARAVRTEPRAAHYTIVGEALSQRPPGANVPEPSGVAGRCQHTTAISGDIRRKHSEFVGVLDRRKDLGRSGDVPHASGTVL